MRKCKKQLYVYYCYDDMLIIYTDDSMRPQNDNLKQGFVDNGASMAHHASVCKIT